MRFEDYENNLSPVYAKFAAAIQELLRKALADRPDLPRAQSIQARAKSPASLKPKLEERGLSASANIEREIKDLAGARLIFYTETDIDRFLQSRLIPELFEVDWKETRIHHPTTENDQQRYQAFHYTVRLREEALRQPGFEEFAGLRCEIQIQTILNHAWAETYHDMIYHTRDKSGFGVKAREALDRRMKKIMDEHLRPASYEFQKVQHDYERLLAGKALFDRGALETLERCADNNERHTILTTIAAHVIPNYDDIGSVYPEIRRTLESTIARARETATKPIETAFGNFAGKTPDTVTSVAVDILETLRYVDPAGTLRSLFAIYCGETDEPLRTRIGETVKRLAKYDMRVWQQAGPYVQTVLTDLLAELSPDELDALRPLALMAWHEVLKSELQGTTFSADAVSFSAGALPALDEIKAIRRKAITGLFGLVDRSDAGDGKRKVIAALHAAGRTPTQARYSNELLQLTLSDATFVVEELGKRAAALPHDLLEHLEHQMLYEYRRARQIVDEETDRFRSRAAAQRLVAAILAFRDMINADPDYVRFKTLVGFESVFAEDWIKGGSDYARTEEYRKGQFAGYIENISASSAAEWFDVIRKCAATKSNDLATFPLFVEFLRELAHKKPRIVIGYLKREDADFMQFLPAILAGLAESEAHADYAALIEDYLERGKHLAAIARQCRAAATDVTDTIRKVLAKALAADEPMAVIDCLIFCVQHCDPSADRRLVDDLFIPSIKYLTGKGDARWIAGAWYLKGAEVFFPHLPSDVAELVLENMLPITRIDHEAERILALIGTTNGASVWKYFQRRIDRKGEQGSEDYEPVPYDLHGLDKALGNNVRVGVSAARAMYRPDDYLFEFSGGRLFHAVFPVVKQPLSAALAQLVRAGTLDDCDFALSLLQNYQGEPSVHDILKELIDKLPADDPRIGKIEIALEKTGVVEGEFGFVEGYRRKKGELAPWLTDARPKVKEFAESYIRRLDQRIASEQRSAEQRKELRKRNFETDEG